MTAAGFRRMALGMKGAVEGAHHDHPDFRVGGRIFATLRKIDGEGTVGMVALVPDQQRVFVRDAPDAFAPEAGAWGRQGCTKVWLKSADAEMVGEAMTRAWRHAVAKGPTRRTPR